MRYALEHENEFERLERQSETPIYDFRSELEGVEFPEDGVLLDAGCGSGIVTRYLGERYPRATVTGCDQSKDRVAMAAKAAHSIPNVSFQVEDLTRLGFEADFLDGIICRYVLEHLPQQMVHLAVKELTRALKPGGRICLIDIDGFFFNLYPQTDVMREFLARLDAALPVDLKIGRKLPTLLAEAGLEDTQWLIKTVEVKGELLPIEYKLMEEKFRHNLPTIATILGSPEKAERFRDDYLQIMKLPHCVLFYNKFVVTARKPLLTLVKPK